TLTTYPKRFIEVLSWRLSLNRGYFMPRMFEPTFEVPSSDGLEEFSKNVIILSIGPDVVRVMYRHRQRGLLVDPGGIWFGRPMEEVLGDPSAAQWFRDNFVSI